MTSLARQLATERCFVLARVQPKEGGGTDKIPTDPATGADIDGQNPANWITGEEAEAYAAMWSAARPAGVLEYGPGIVIAEGSGRFCVDLDKCREGEGWQPHVRAVLDRFPGAYVEVSASMTGLHIVARCIDMPLHGTRCADLRAEAYSKSRFIYTTGLGAYGDSNADCTQPFKLFVAQFFPVKAHGTAEWSNGPCVAWSGPTDDADLIARARRAASGKSFMRQGVAFEHLWTANADVLGSYYLASRPGQAYDASRADQALANHLAFWTGNDCERIARLMWQSALRREKWELRPVDYLQRTIMLACADTTDWYNDRRAAAPPEVSDTESSAPVKPEVPSVTVELAVVPSPPVAVPVPTGAPLAPGELPPLVQSYIPIHQQQQIFAGWCHIEDRNEIQKHNGDTIDKARLDVWGGGFEWAMTADGKTPSKSAWDAFTSNTIHRFPRADTQYFNPREPLGTRRTRDKRDEINSYQPLEIRRVTGDVTPFLALISKMIPGERDRRILLTWCASLVRNLGCKFMWAPFIQATKGNGKTTLAEVLAYCIGATYTHWAKSDQLAEKFNDFLERNILLILDEAKTQDQFELQEILKQLITQRRYEIRAMNVSKRMKDICFNVLIISNYKNAVKIDEDERRYAPFFCAQQGRADNIRDGLTTSYFVELRRWLNADGFAIIYDYLMWQYPIDPEFDPAGDCVVAPITMSTAEAITASRGGVEQEILRAVEQRMEGFRNGWISSTAVDHLLARIGKDKAIPPNVRKSLIAACGYEPHPALPDGLCDVPWTDGTVPRLYITRGHPWALPHLTPAQIRDGFIAHQQR